MKYLKFELEEASLLALSTKGSRKTNNYDCITDNPGGDSCFTYDCLK